MINLNFVFSEIFISISIMFLLILGVFKNKSSNLIYNLSILSLFIILISNYNLFGKDELTIFNNSYKIDFLSSFMKFLVIRLNKFIM